MSCYRLSNFVSTHLLSRQSFYAYNVKSLRNVATSKKGREEAIVTSEDGNIVVCWHPEPVIPYECTKELPKEKPYSTFKQNLEAAKSQFKKVHPAFEMKQLQAITYTNKHIWFPRPSRKMVKFKEKEPRDREYL